MVIELLMVAKENKSRITKLKMAMEVVEVSLIFHQLLSNKKWPCNLKKA
jgi:hypothetical protein